MPYERHAISCLDDLLGRRASGVEVAIVSCSHAGTFEQLGALRVERGRRLSREGAGRPIDLQRALTLKRGPGVVGNDSNAGCEIGRDWFAMFGPACAIASRTPGILFAAVASNDFSSPPKVGQRVTTAVGAPGSVASNL